MILIEFLLDVEEGDDLDLSEIFPVSRPALVRELESNSRSP